jgi:parallel beta helix pectate lyase-like protein
MPAHTFLSTCSRATLLILPALLLFPMGLRAQLFVDCSGTNPNEYPSINAALQQAATVGSTVLITGTCTETVNVQGMVGLNMGAPFGQTATLNGALTISNSQNVCLYGLQVTNSPIDGITVNDSTAVLLEACTANSNTLNGLRVQNMSDVAVVGLGGAFGNNGSSGVWGNVGSLVWFNNWAGPVDVSSNALDGIECEQSTCGILGNTTITNNGISGVDLVAGSKMEFAAYYGPNLVESNKSGGVSVRERSRISIFTAQTTIRGNGAVGVTAGFGSQVTLSDVQISGHTSVGVDLYANSQAWLFGANQIQNNGSSSDPTSAAIRIDGNSEAYLRGSTVAQNNGPALLVLVNSSADFSGVSFAGNSGGIIACDNSAVMVSDLAPAAFGHSEGATCRRPQLTANHQMSAPVFTPPNSAPQKAAHEKYVKLASKP